MRTWRNYTNEDYRIEQYCKLECPYCQKEKNGQAFCYGWFKSLNPDKKNLRGGGVECTTSIKICFDTDYELREDRPPLFY